jgi:hypothetical protein
MRQYTAVALVLGGILVGACVPNPFAAKETNAETPAQSTTWEYEVEELPRYVDDYKAVLNKQGHQGYELVMIQSGFAVYKRPKH